LDDELWEGNFFYKKKKKRGQLENLNN
jgi:hypothetical protein